MDFSVYNIESQPGHCDAPRGTTILTIEILTI